MMSFMNKEQLNEMATGINEIIEDINPDNPLEIIGFANSLINMGNHLLNQTSTRLLSQAYSSEELELIQKDLKNKQEQILKK